MRLLEHISILCIENYHHANRVLRLKFGVRAKESMVVKVGRYKTKPSVMVKEEVDASVVGWTNEVTFTKQVGVALIKWDTREIPGGARVESPEEVVATLKEERKILSLSFQWCAAPPSRSSMVPALVEITLNDVATPFFSLSMVWLHLSHAPEWCLLL